MLPVTIVVVPRERFSCTRAALESIKQHTSYPYQLLYLDGNSPKAIEDYLNVQAQQHDFQLLRFERYLYPNQAKNIALQHIKSHQIKSEYIVFLDNDVIVSPNWLTSLVECADETKAAVVTPLICDSNPLHQKIHMAGGDCYIWSDLEGKRHLWSEMYYANRLIETVRQDLHRRPTSLIEFHCFLVRREALDKIGQFDPMMYSTREHVDFCLSVKEAREQIYFEPKSIVTYLPDYPQDQSDLLFYALRWSNTWKLKSLQHLKDKWKLTEDRYFQASYNNLARHRQKYLLSPLISKLAPHLKQSPSQRREVWQLLAGWEMKVNDYITQHHSDKMYLNEIERLERAK